ncbi:MAG: branched-chain amino acid ABC transporter substrate-binding protein [Alphaproteobacteria bacterium]|nr:branched-chain amino acid ABC transporter substrate-binding protein [Alphaproteobacteria bacterium]
MRKISGFLMAAAAAVALSAAPASAQDLVVATAGPMTGSDAVFGEQMKRGAEMAIKHINDKGGVLGKKLKLELGDDQCEPKQALPVANSFVQKKVIFVAGHYCSGVSIPASAVYAENNILQITPASTNPRLTDEAKTKGWKTVFRTCGRDDIQGVVAGKYLAEKYKGKKIAILHDKSPYGQGIAEEVRKNMNAAGQKEAIWDSFSRGDKDYTALVSKMKQQAIEVVYVGSYHTETGLLVKQSREQGFGAQFVSEDALVTDEFWKISGPAGEGLLMTFAPDPVSNPAAKAVVDEFKKGGYNPEGYTLYTYAAFQVFAEAAKKANSTDAQKVAAQIRGKTFETVLGTLIYDDKGDVSNSVYVWYIWKNGKYQQM